MNRSDTFKLVRLAAQAADDKLGDNILAIDVRKLTSLTECFLFVGATSTPQIKALEDSIREKLEGEGNQLKRTDGQCGGIWRVLDYGDFIIHLMNKSAREFYGLERLWNEGHKIPLSIKTPEKPKLHKSPKRKKK